MYWLSTPFESGSKYIGKTIRTIVDRASSRKMDQAKLKLHAKPLFQTTPCWQSTIKIWKKRGPRKLLLGSPGGLSLESVIHRSTVVGKKAGGRRHSSEGDNNGPPNVWLANLRNIRNHRLCRKLLCKYKQKYKTQLLVHKTMWYHTHHNLMRKSQAILCRET